MPKPRQSDNPNALTEHIGIMVTKAELAKILELGSALGLSKSAASRFVIRAGLDTPKVKSFTPQEQDKS